MAALSVNDLLRRMKQGKPIKDFTQSIVGGVDRLIERHESHFGRNLVSVDIPVTATISGLRRDDAQRAMYASLIAVYRDRGFDVRIEMPSPQKTVLHLFYDIKFDQAVKDSLDALIRRHRVGDDAPGGGETFRRLRAGDEPLRVESKEGGAAGGAPPPAPPSI
jgi:hypothetical protein